MYLIDDIIKKRKCRKLTEKSAEELKLEKCGLGYRALHWHEIAAQRHIIRFFQIIHSSSEHSLLLLPNVSYMQDLFKNRNDFFFKIILLGYDFFMLSLILLLQSSKHLKSFLEIMFSFPCEPSPMKVSSILGRGSALTLLVMFVLYSCTSNDVFAGDIMV